MMPNFAITFATMLTIMFLVPNSVLPPVRAQDSSSTDEPQPVPTNQIVIEVKSGDEAEAEKIAADSNMKFVGRVGTLKTYFLLEARDPDEVSNVQRNQRSDSLSDAVESVVLDNRVSWIEWQRFEPRVHRSPILRRRKRADTLSNFNDPLFEKQWYLGSDTEHGMFIEKAWAMGYTGAGVVVSVVDDGIEHSHDDLKDNYVAMASKDFIDNDADPTPPANAAHGTRCASLVASKADNDVCTVGVAHGAKIGGIRVLGKEGSTDAGEAQAFTHNHDYIDVYSVSWGPLDSGRSFNGPKELSAAAMFNGIEEGRRGLGNIFVWAVGNGAEHGDSCAFDGYITSPYTIGVAAVAYDNKYTSYSEACPAVLCTAYSWQVDSDLPRIPTADIDGGCSNEHSGTSAAVPIVAGVVALMLQANPLLTWRDVQNILIQTSNPEPLLGNEGWKRNGVGRMVSDEFGYGIVNAEKAVNLAERWLPSSAKQERCNIIYKAEHKSLKLLHEEYLEVEIDVGSNCANIEALEHVQLTVDIPYVEVRGVLSVRMISPMGTESIMMPTRRRDIFDGGLSIDTVRWPFMSLQQWGESPQGKWIIEIDNAGVMPFEKGTFEGLTLILSGAGKETGPKKMDFSWGDVFKNGR